MTCAEVIWASCFDLARDVGGLRDDEACGPHATTSMITFAAACSTCWQDRVSVTAVGVGHGEPVLAPREVAAFPCGNR